MRKARQCDTVFPIRYRRSGCLEKCSRKLPIKGLLGGPFLALDAATSDVISALVAEELKVALQTLQPSAGAIPTDPISDLPAAVAASKDPAPGPIDLDLPGATVGDQKVPDSSLPPEGNPAGEGSENEEDEGEFDLIRTEVKERKRLPTGGTPSDGGTPSLFALRSPAASKLASRALENYSTFRGVQKSPGRASRTRRLYITTTYLCKF